LQDEPMRDWSPINAAIREPNINISTVLSAVMNDHVMQ